MNGLALLATIVVAHALALISPGPDFFITVRNSVSYSRRSGIFTALGIGTGIILHITYCILGLALIISKSPLLFNTIKLLGAAYLLFIGAKALFGAAGHLRFGSSQKKHDIAPFHAYRAGFLTNALNPKVTIFFLSLFTLVISPSTPLPLLLVAGAMMVIDTVAWFCFVAIVLTHAKIRTKYDSFQGTLGRVFGAVLIGVGIELAISTR